MRNYSDPWKDTIREWMQKEVENNGEDYFDEDGDFDDMKLVDKAAFTLAPSPEEVMEWQGEDPIWEIAEEVLTNYLRSRSASLYRKKGHTGMSHKFAVRINGSYQVYRRVEAAPSLSTEELTDMLISYIEYGFNITGNESIREFAKEVYSVAKQVPILQLSDKLKEMTIDHYAYGGVTGSDYSLPSPFNNFVLVGLHDSINWDDVALAVSSAAQEQMQFN